MDDFQPQDIRAGDLMDRVVETEIAWHKVEDWNPNFIYPLPVGYMARNQEEYIIDAWMIFQQDPSCNEDIVAVNGFERMTFTQALAICEMHNGKRLVHDKPNAVPAANLERKNPAHRGHDEQSRRLECSGDDRRA